MKRIKRFYEHLKFSDYPLWYNLTVGLIVNSKIYFHLYYKHTKRHKADLERIREGVMRCKRKYCNIKENKLEKKLSK